jgi:hypothetical protein
MEDLMDEGIEIDRGILFLYGCRIEIDGGIEIVGWRN